jgi:hypothetical protein
MSSFIFLSLIFLSTQFSEFAILYWPIQSGPIAGSGSNTLQVKNLRYSRTGVLRYAFGPASAIEAPEPPGQPPKNHLAQEELKPFWMLFKKDEAKETRKSKYETQIFGFEIY